MRAFSPRRLPPYRSAIATTNSSRTAMLTSLIDITPAAYPNFRIFRIRILIYQSLGRFLVTRKRIGPAVDRFDDLVGEAEQGIEASDVLFGCRGLADAQGLAALGGQNDSADLVGLQRIAHGGPGGVEALVEEGL